MLNLVDSLSIFGCLIIDNLVVDSVVHRQNKIHCGKQPTHSVHLWEYVLVLLSLKYLGIYRIYKKYQAT